MPEQAQPRWLQANWDVFILVKDEVRQNEQDNNIASILLFMTTN